MASRKTFFTIEVTTIKNDYPATESFQLSQRTFANLKRSLSHLVSDGRAKTHDMGQHFMLDVALLIETWQAAAGVASPAGCAHDPHYRHENEANGGVGCPMCNAAHNICDDCAIDCAEF